GQHGLAGPAHTPLDVSYLADTVVLLRYFEARGAVRQAISVMKKRAGPHERSIRELSLSSAGLAVGEPLHDCEDVYRLCAETSRGAGAVLLAEEGLDGSALDLLAFELDRQPPWSDLPLLV